MTHRLIIQYHGPCSVRWRLFYYFRWVLIIVIWCLYLSFQFRLHRRSWFICLILCVFIHTSVFCSHTPKNSTRMQKQWGRSGSFYTREVEHFWFHAPLSHWDPASNSVLRFSLRRAMVQPRKRFIGWIAFADTFVGGLQLLRAVHSHFIQSTWALKQNFCRLTESTWGATTPDFSAIVLQFIAIWMWCTFSNYWLKNPQYFSALQ